MIGLQYWPVMTSRSQPETFPLSDIATPAAFDIVPFEVCLVDFCFPDYSSAALESNTHQRSTMTPSSYPDVDMNDSIMDLDWSDPAEFYQELPKGEQLSTTARPLAVMETNITTFATPVAHPFLERSASLEIPTFEISDFASIGHQNNYVGNHTMASSPTFAPAFPSAEQDHDALLGLWETSPTTQKKIARRLAINRWQEKKKKSAQKLIDKYPKTARQKATARRHRCNGRFDKVKSEWVAATEFFHPKPNRESQQKPLLTQAK